MSGFQSVINQQQAPGVEGDFASANPKASLLAGEGALVAGANGVVVGRFAWVSNGVVNNTGTGAPAGFVHREGQASVTTWLGESSMTIQPGVQMTLMTAGDYWVKTAGAATVGRRFSPNCQMEPLPLAMPGRQSRITLKQNLLLAVLARLAN